jgi:serine/threonine-protein kinase
VGNNPDNEYLSDGISEELIHALGKVEGLRVVGRTSAFAFKGKNEDIRTIGERLNASAVLEGSVRAVGNRMRITAQLISADTGYELFSESYDRELDDVLGVQVEIAKSIVKSLTVTLLVDDGPMFESATDNFEAYELYLRGRFQWNKRTEDGLRQSIDYLTQSVAADPNFAVAFAGLADSYATLGIYGSQLATEVMPLARDAANRALAVDSTLSEALTSLGCVASVYDWDWEAAENYFKQAIEENPKYPVAHQWYAVNCLAPLGRFQEARAQLSRARTLDPLSLVVNLSHGLSRYLERDYEGAVDEYNKVLEIDPRFGMAHYFLGQVYERRGDHDAALSCFQRAIELTGGSPEITAAVGHAYATAGRVDEARGIVAQLQAPSAARYVSPALIGQVYVGLGEHDAALEWLDRGRVDRSPEMIWLGVRPLFDSLRGDKRFLELLRAIGLAEHTLHDTSAEGRSND